MDRRLFAALAVGCIVLSLSVGCLAETVDLSNSPRVDEAVASGHVTATDTTTQDRERESMSAQARRAQRGGENFTFKAEVARLMDIIINSLYSNKDIFLRELISNGSDALDKIRFMSLTDKSVLGEGDQANLEIKIWVDKDNKILYIRDTGVGMTKEDLINNLGTIAKSGTSAFLEQMQKGGDINLIGQFGVGFYSAFLVADWVEVVSKANADTQHIWASAADGSFTISEDTENEPLGRGTLIKLHLKEEAVEYLDEAKLKALVFKYSEFINFPIYLLTEKEVEVKEEKAEEAAEDSSEEEGSEDDVDDDEEESDDGAEDDTEDASKKGEWVKKEKREEWELVNDNKAIWLRNPSDVTDEEYQKFYKAVSKDWSDALNWSHFKAEGDMEFKSVLFIPKVAPFDFYDKYYEKQAPGLKLYVRRVFISDDFNDIIPRYLSFVKGVIDSDTLPLNVSREMLQAETALKTMKKKLVRKVLDMLKKMAEDERKCKEAEKEEGEDTVDKPSEEECKRYGTFWEQFGRAIKLGIIEDTTNRGRLAKLMRFYTSKSPDTLTSLDEYIGRMKEGQKDIYFLAGTSKKEVSESPFLERLLARGYEVIYLYDVLDEYVMQHLMDYEDKKFQNASKEDLKLSDADEVEKKKEKALKEEFKDLTKWWKKVLGGSVTSVRVSNRLSTTPCVVVTGKYGQTANMERIMRAQAFSSGGAAAMSNSQKSLEINPRHPLIKALKEKVASDESDESAELSAKVLFDAALIESGFMPDDAKAISRRVYEVVQKNMGVDSTVVEDMPEDDEDAPADADSAEEPAAKDAEHEEL